jgi:hypothetical protein
MKDSVDKSKGMAPLIYSLKEERKQFHLINELYRDLMRGYRASFTEDELELLSLSLGVLHNVGFCPSVAPVLIKSDPNLSMDKGTRIMLAYISVAEHSVRVTRNMIGNTKNRLRGLPSLVTPSMVFSSIAHDWGKTPYFRRELITKSGFGDHPAISRRAFEDLAKGKTIRNMTAILNAIRNHHSDSDEYLTGLLKDADAAARREEIAGMTESTNWEEWFSAQEFLTRLRSSVNILTNDRECDAFSYRDTLYVSPRLLYSTAKAIMTEKGVVEASLLIPHHKDLGTLRVVASLRALGLVKSEIPNDKVGLIYLIKTTVFARSALLLALKIEACEDSRAELEKRKTGWLELIQYIQQIDSEKGNSGI